MAKRPVFVPDKHNPFVKAIDLKFDWYPGFSIAQKQRNIEALHIAAAKAGVEPVLEISTKSSNPFGVDLSAFNLKLRFNNGFEATVEQLFQSSKVFENGGPYTDFRKMSGSEIKKDRRLKESGSLIKFQIGNIIWDLEPKTAFYDWLFIHAVNQNENLKNKILNYKGFTDIEFNPKRSINCQAKSAAFFLSLYNSGNLYQALSGKKSYLDLLLSEKKEYESVIKRSKVEQNEIELKQLNLFS